jgi:hypothetical protein
MSSAFVSYSYVGTRYRDASIFSVISGPLRHPRRGNHLIGSCFSLCRRRYSSLVRRDWRNMQWCRIPRQRRNSFYLNESRGISNMVSSYYKRFSSLMATSLRPRATNTESIFWDAFWTSTFALCVSIGLFCYFPSNPLLHVDSLSSFLSSQQLLLCEPARHDSPSVDTKTNGDRKSRVFSTMSMISSIQPQHDHIYYDSTRSSDGEMAFREPNSIPEQLLKSHISSSHSIPVAESAFSSTKPYDVSARNQNGSPDLYVFSF